jgi:hypothetical protein
MVFHKGEIPPLKNPNLVPRPDSGFVLMVSNDQNRDLNNQIREAIAFLSHSEKEIRRMNNYGVDNRLFNFGVERQDVIERYAYLPPQLLTAMARFEMGVTMSSYVLPKG